MKPKRWGLALALLAVAGFAAASTAAPKPKVGISGAWVSADSVRVTATWTAVSDARGSAVTYSWSFWRDGAQAAGGSTTALSESRTFARPLAGDTARYYAEVTAVDSRGRPSSTARSPVLLVVTPWTPPPPPVIRIDTVAYQPGMPDTITLHIAPPTWGGSVQVGALSMAPGDTVTVCGVRWRDGYGERGAPITWATSQPNAIMFTPTTADCALVRALTETSLALSPLRLARP